MHRTLLIFGVVASLLSATHAAEVQDSSHAVLGSRAELVVDDVDPNLKMEMDAEFANLRPRAGPTNFQVFTQTIGGALPDPITATNDPQRPFAVNGETFTSLLDAVQRSCANQNNACSKAANAKGQNQGRANGNGNGNGNNGGNNGQQGAKAEDELTVPNCGKQQQSCQEANKQLGLMKLDTEASKGDSMVFCN